MKICTKCEVPKDFGEFSKNKRKANGLRSYCRVCASEIAKAHYKTFEGYLTRVYHHQRSSSKRRGYESPNYTKQQLGEWLINQPSFGELWNNYVFNDYPKDLIPSPDRLDDYEPYALNNLQLLTWQENRSKAYKDQKEGRNNKQSKAVLKYTKENLFVQEYYSIHEAGRRARVSTGNIINACKGKLKSVGGFKWEYKN